MKNIFTSVLMLFIFNVTSVKAQSVSTFIEKADSFFSTYVKNGRVDYQSIKKNPASLNELTEIAKNVSVSKNNALEYQAFWINGYNVFVIKNIVDNYPLKSPLDVAGFFDRTKQNIGGEQITLNDIENKLLRGNFPSEARFHFVLVCAGLGCPPIINTAYKASTLDSQLQKQAVKALNDANFIRVNKNKVKVSQIFEWYKGDFTQNGKDLVAYINQFRTEQLPEAAKVSYYPYDWTLNAIK